MRYLQVFAAFPIIAISLLFASPATAQLRPLGGGCLSSSGPMPVIDVAYVVGPNVPGPSGRGLQMIVSDQFEWLFVMIDPTAFWPPAGLPLAPWGLDSRCTLMVAPTFWAFVPPVPPPSPGAPSGSTNSWCGTIPIPAALHGYAKVQAMFGDSGVIGGACLTDGWQIGY
jgi:hypothetical protein